MLPDRLIKGWKYFFYKYDESNTPKYGFRYLLLMRHTPFVNFFWDLFFDGQTPGESEVKDLLEMLGLLNALLLGSGVGIVASVNFAELTAADVLYADPSQGYSVWWTTAVPPSTNFYFWIHWALTMFFIGVVAIVWVYADMLGKTGEACDVEYWKDFYRYKKVKNVDSEFSLERLIRNTTGRDEFEKWRQGQHKETKEEKEERRRRRRLRGTRPSRSIGATPNTRSSCRFSLPCLDASWLLPRAMDCL